MGMLERGGEVRTVVVDSRRKHVLQAEVKKHVEAGTALYTDALLSYEGLATDYAHQVIDHAVQYSGWPRTHQWTRKLLVAAEAFDFGNLSQRRAFPLVPVLG